MTKHVKDSRFPTLLIIIVATIAIYGFCFVAKFYFHQIEAEISEVNEEIVELIKLYPESSAAGFLVPNKMNLKLIFNQSQPSKEEPKIDLIDIRDVKFDICQFSIFFNIAWTEDLNIESKFSDVLASEIEDAYDSKYMETGKSVGINIEEIKQSSVGVFLELKAFSIEGNMSRDDLHQLFEDNSGRIYDNVVRKLTEKENESEAYEEY